MDQANPAQFLLNEISRGEKRKGSEKPSQVKPNEEADLGKGTGEDKDSFSSLLTHAIEDLQRAKQKVPETSQPATEIGNSLQRLTMVLNRFKGTGVPKGKPAETELPGNSELDLQGLLSDSRGTLAGPSPVSQGMSQLEG